MKWLPLPGPLQMELWGSSVAGEGERNSSGLVPSVPSRKPQLWGKSTKGASQADQGSLRCRTQEEFVALWGCCLNG